MTKRKPLGDALAQSFVYGQGEATPNVTSSNSSPSEDATAGNSPPQSQGNPPKPTLNTQEPSLMERLLAPPEQKEPTKRFTIDLPESIHRKLSIVAARSGRKKADIIRVLLDDLLKDFQE